MTPLQVIISIPLRQGGHYPQAANKKNLTNQNMRFIHSTTKSFLHEKDEAFLRVHALAYC